jgi:hypothetical protein
MTLYLTSDEVFDTKNGLSHKYNSRTNFSNYILPDFFQDSPFNLSMREIYFDPKFPTLAFTDCPHVITIISANEHNLNDFPESFSEIPIFRSMFEHDGINRAHLVDVVRGKHEPQGSGADFNIFYEIHPRLNFAFAIAYAKDITVNSKAEVVKFLNEFMFPFHKDKPIKYSVDSKIIIESNLDMYMSKNLLSLLGFTSFQENTQMYQNIKFPSVLEIESELDHILKIKQNSTDLLEQEFPIYTHYRRLGISKPKGEISVEYLIGDELEIFNTSFDLEVFSLNQEIVFNYDDLLKQINENILISFLEHVRKKHEKSISNNREKADVDEFFEWVNTVVRSDHGLENWGGPILLENRGAHFTISLFNARDDISYFQRLMNAAILDEPQVIQNIGRNILLFSKVTCVKLNQTLSNFFNIKQSIIEFPESNQEAFVARDAMDYFKSVRYELTKSFHSDIPFTLQLMSIHDTLQKGVMDQLVKHFKTGKENIYFIQKKRKYVANVEIDLFNNYPKLILVTGNFIEHSLFGSEQLKILNFFPITPSNSKLKHHTFKNPIRLKSFTDYNFHITLLDENFQQLKAATGVPTLIVLEKSNLESMFPVTIFSSDIANKSHYPENKSNAFKNKLSFPLQFSDKSQWTASLRSIAFPKIKNIYSEQCRLKVSKHHQDNWISVSVGNSYVADVETLVELINSELVKLNVDEDEIDENYIPPPKFYVLNARVVLETNDYDCKLGGDMLKLLGLSYSYVNEELTFRTGHRIIGMVDPNLHIFQPQEIIVISNIVEESYYAQSRPNILGVVPVPEQKRGDGYNYVQIQEHNDIPIALDRIDEIDIEIVSRKGNLIEFVDINDIKIQLQFKKSISS